MIQIAMIVGYLVLTAAVSLYFAKRAKQNTSAFYTASRSMPMIVVSALLFSEIIAGAGRLAMRPTHTPADFLPQSGPTGEWLLDVSW